MDKERAFHSERSKGQMRRFVIPLPAPEPVVEEFPSPPPKVDTLGHINYSTTALARDPGHRERIMEGRRRAGIGSSFILSPQGVVDAATRGDILGILTSVQREVIDLRFCEGLTQAEVAERTGRNFRTVSKIERAGLQRLNKRLLGERLKREKANARIILAGGHIDLSRLTFLTDAQRDVLLLRYERGLSTGEVAHRMGKPQKRVNGIENAALDKLVIELRALKAQR